MPHGDQSGNDLENELDAGPQRMGVIHHTYSHNNAGTDQNAPQRAVNVCKEEDTDHTADKNRQGRPYGGWGGRAYGGYPWARPPHRLL